VAARSKAWVCGRLLAGIAGSDPAGVGLDVCSECCVLPRAFLGRSFVQKSPSDCSVSECDYEASIMGGLEPLRGCCAMGKK
jgi:hypothetical protein